MELTPDDNSIGFLLPADQIVPTGEETFAGLKALATIVAKDNSVPGNGISATGLQPPETEETAVVPNAANGNCGKKKANRARKEKRGRRKQNKEKAVEGTVEGSGKE